ncbi:probable glycosyltransferase At5g03795 isoform X1 [Cannabis sativa]|nr:probable glycosyltransferase At5g03795 isoform X1 [Cannabis sativa]
MYNKARPNSNTSTLIYLVLPIIPLLGIFVLFFTTTNTNNSLLTSSPSSSSSSYILTDNNDSIIYDENDHHNPWQPQLLISSSSSSAAAQAPLQQVVLTTTISLPPASASAPAPQLMGNHDQRISNRRRRRRRKSNLFLEKIEARLVKARDIIMNKNSNTSIKDWDFNPRLGSIYRNPRGFHRSYLEMEKVLKIYVYEEGEGPIFHEGPCKNIYSSEGRFINEIEKEKTVFRTRDPNRALLYFLPFSVVRMVQYLYKDGTNDLSSIKTTVVDYVDLISRKYPFWNRTLGADHFMLSCHDWGPKTSSFVPSLFHNSIRVLCNANTSEGFKPSKDASLPEINLFTGEMTSLGGPSPSKRTTLAFFAGRLHGHIRSLLLKRWKNNDTDIQVYETLPRGVSYIEMLRNSKFCLCPSGYEVASPRVVEAIYAECVPVLISDGYIPPFSDVLNWKAFSVEIKVKDIPRIKEILMGISSSHYVRMQRRVKMAQRHFVVNDPPKRYDVFHMTLHSLWLRRLNIRVADYYS